MEELLRAQPVQGVGGWRVSWSNGPGLQNQRLHRQGSCFDSLDVPGAAAVFSRDGELSALTES